MHSKLILNIIGGKCPIFLNPLPLEYKHRCVISWYRVLCLQFLNNPVKIITWVQLQRILSSSQRFEVNSNLSPSQLICGVRFFLLFLVQSRFHWKSLGRWLVYLQVYVVHGQALIWWWRRGWLHLGA